MEIYRNNRNKYSNELKRINKKYNSISLLRLLSIFLFLGSFYYYLKTNDILYVGSAMAFFAIFAYLMRIHGKLTFQKQFKQALLEINTNEAAFLESNTLSFENGLEFNDFHHPYAYDLDVFGEHSLFQNLNRTATYIGKKTLAKQLLEKSSNDEILSKQAAIKELSGKLGWRQDFLALAKISQDSESSYETLLQWSTFNSKPLSKASVIISFVTPILFLGILIAYLVTFNTVFASILAYVFIFNMSFLGKFVKRITAETSNSSNIDKIIHQYSLLVQRIEEETFQSEKMIDLQKKLIAKNRTASAHLKHLSELFSRMDSIGNIFTTTTFNGTFLFHFHNLKALIQWKNDNAITLKDWLDVIGEFEMLNSLANFSFNNPDFAYPTVNSELKIEFSDLSHPLLNSKTRVGNTVTFYPQSFMILTGSNMSGKSTFLRSLGVNMVLAGMGSPVCATKANLHPLPVLVSMRLSDSLSDSESYFFAEIKRLKQIMDGLEAGPAFVLLDEILRGTNSDDKRSGTIGVVKKIIGRRAIGAIATHDIEVCLTTATYPDTLVNKCFEVEIHHDELHFDYKLRDGICQNKSATFLMKKMEII
jgi:DNA mismatch repair ATPase MutS